MKSPRKKLLISAARGIIIIGLILTAGCSAAAPSSGAASDIASGDELTSQASDLEEDPPAAAESDSDMDQGKSQECQLDFEKRELREPYQRLDEGQARYTLSQAELQDYLDLMGIKTLCLPAAFGAPFINIDWNEAAMPATGRMVSLGFEDLYQGAGWSAAYLVYSTYDFEVGSEYEVFGGKGDQKQLETGAVTEIITAGDVQGLLRYHAGLPMGMQMIMKTYVFPFDNHYVAAVINLGVFDPSEAESIITEMEKGDHPSLAQEQVLLLDALVASLVFNP